jgi:hypothetical protein
MVTMTSTMLFLAAAISLLFFTTSVGADDSDGDDSVGKHEH